jgi:hypothetical protein
LAVTFSFDQIGDLSALKTPRCACQGWIGRADLRGISNQRPEGNSDGHPKGDGDLRCAWGLVTMGGRALGISAADKCESAKNKIAGKYALCRQKAEAKAIKSATAPDFTKCDPKFSQKWAAAKMASGGMCPTQGDESALQSCIAAHTSEVAAALTNGGTCGSGGLPEAGQTQCDQGAGTWGACPPRDKTGQRAPALPGTT